MTVVSLEGDPRAARAAAAATAAGRTVVPVALEDGARQAREPRHWPAMRLLREARGVVRLMRLLRSTLRLLRATRDRNFAIVHANDLETLAADGSDGPFLLSTVDTVTGPKAYADFMERARVLNAAITLALTSPGTDEKPLLVQMRADDSRIEAFGDGEYATAGVYAVRPIILREAEAARRDGLAALRNFLQRLLERGYEIAGIPISESIDVDRPEDLAAAEALLRSAQR